MTMIKMTEEDGNAIVTVVTAQYGVVEIVLGKVSEEEKTSWPNIGVDSIRFLDLPVITT